MAGERVRRAAQGALLPLYLRYRRYRHDAVAQLLTASAVHDPYPLYRSFRDRGPLHRSALGLHLTTSHAVASEVLREPGWLTDPRRSRSFSGSEADVAAGLSLLNMDPPDHTRIRRLVSRAFTPRAVERLRGVTEAVAERLVHGVVARGGGEVIRDLAYPLPLAVISEVLGVPPQDGETFRQWGYDLAPSLDAMPSPAVQADLERTGAEADAYFRALIERRRHDPGEDLVSALVQAQAHGAELSDTELLNTCTLLLLAGFVTTVNLVGNGLLALLQHPQQLGLLREEPDRSTAAVDEILRFDSPVQFTGRIAAADTDLAGRRVRAGEQILVVIGGANRDPEVFDRPDVFDITRDAPHRHLSFASGIHHCLGAALARMEGQVLLETVLRDAPGITLSGAVARRRVQNLRGLASLPIQVAA